jgi:VRR-NUC domain
MNESKPRRRYGARGTRSTRGYSERDLQAATLELLRRRGWRAYHTFDSRRSEPGFPDIVAVRAGVLLAIECKTDAGVVSPDQAAWLLEFGRVRIVDAIVLRPAPTYDDLVRYLEIWEAQGDRTEPEPDADRRASRGGGRPDRGETGTAAETRTSRRRSSGSRRSPRPPRSPASDPVGADSADDSDPAARHPGESSPAGASAGRRRPA